jgi:glycosyltransferase involved in cell wall biosynthesis
MFKVKKNGKNKNFFIVSIGGLNHGKRFDKLIKAVLYIIPEYNNIKLIIVGEGKQRKELEKLIGEKYEYISLVGQKTKPDIISLFKKADLFVSTSDFETFGVACAEALSTGTPVVGYDNGGINDIITSSQYGVILKNNSVLSFRKAIINYIKNKDFYNSDLIREEAERLFHPNQIFDKYNHLYSEILKNK